MNDLTFNQNEAMRRLDSLQIPNTISQGIVDLVSQWAEQSGPEWTVKRLKALKTDFIHLIAGTEPPSKWIRYAKGVPKGPFGRLFRFGKREPKYTKRVLNALMIYTTFVASKETQQQLDKFYDSVSSRPLDLKTIEIYTSLIKPEAEKLKVKKKQVRDLTSYVSSPSKRCPTSDGRSAPDEKWLDTIDVLWKTSLGRTICENYPLIATVVEPLRSQVREGLRKPPSFDGEIENIGVAGKIGHIQEPGMKLRAVANPYRVYQLALSRLGDQIYDLIETLPWDCTHDQDAGTSWAERELSSGHEMFAVDLSDATNQFPLHLQLNVLKAINGVEEQDIDLFETLSSAPWYSPTHGFVSWTKGQPLGLYPSFGVFALTHGLLLTSLERELKLREGENFRVLGDDIVISNLDLYNSYRKALLDLEIDVSEEKTLTSSQATEFGGRVIVPGHIIVLGKWRLSSDRSFLDYLRNVGPRCLKHLRPRQRKVAEMVVALPEPIGLNQNPKGLPLDLRLRMEEEVRHLFEPELELPLYERSAWTRTVMNSQFAKSLVRSRDPIEFPLGQFARYTPPGVPRNSDVLSRISYLTGVPIQPSTQLSALAKQNIGVLERIHKIANELNLMMLRAPGDPRGPSVLEIWEQRIKRAETSCLMVAENSNEGSGLEPGEIADIPFGEPG